MGTGVPTWDGRYRVLDGYRFLAASAIVCFHYNYDFNLGLGEISRAFDKLQVYVDLFFVLSGFVIAEAYASRMASGRDYGEFLWRRLARVYPLHLATLAAIASCVLAGRLSGRLDPIPDLFDPGALPQNLLLVHAWGTTSLQTWNIPSWSISAEMLVYLLFPAFLLACERLPAWAVLAGCAAYAVAVAEARRALGATDLMDATTDGALRAVPGFLAGVAVSRGMSRARRIPRVPWALAHAAFLAPLPLMHLGAPAWAAAATFPGVVALAAAAERGGRDTVLAGPAFARLGGASYALYLLHFPLALLALRVLGIPLADGAPGRAMEALALAAVAVAAALAVHARFEVPAQRGVVSLLRKAGKPRRPPPSRAAPSR